MPAQEENIEAAAGEFLDLESTPASESYTILYVDDEPANLRVFQSTFRWDFQVLTANSADEALEILEKVDVAVLVSDQRMPGKTGTELFEITAKTYPDTVRILLTGYSDLDAVQEAINQGGIFYYLNKPWDDTKLLNILNRACELFQLKRDKDALIGRLRLSHLTLEAARDVVYWINDMGVIIRVNEAASRLLGWSRDELVGMSFVNVIPQHLRPDWKDYISEIRQAKAVTRETMIRKKSGEEVPVEIKVHHLQFEDENYYCGFLWDITDRIRRKERMLSVILETEDRERSRIAQDLHDSLGQKMTGVALLLEIVRREAERLTPVGQEKLLNACGQLNAGIAELRELSHNLMPKSISDFGIRLSLESLVENLRKTSDCEIFFYTNLGPERLPEPTELSLYRIVQEAVNNILKHAQASEIVIQLMKYDDLISLTIEDNGQGFDPESIDWHSKAFGLNTMKNRTNALSGEFSVDSRPGKGTVISVQLPSPQPQVHG